MSFSNFINKLSKQPPSYERKVGYYHLLNHFRAIFADLFLLTETLQIRKNIRYVLLINNAYLNMLTRTQEPERIHLPPSQ